jgi:hypothetical protein
MPWAHARSHTPEDAMSKERNRGNREMKKPKTAKAAPTIKPSSFVEALRPSKEAAKIGMGRRKNP